MPRASRNDRYILRWNIPGGMRQSNQQRRRLRPATISPIGNGSGDEWSIALTGDDRVGDVNHTPLRVRQPSFPQAFRKEESG